MCSFELQKSLPDVQEDLQLKSERDNIESDISEKLQSVTEIKSMKDALKNVHKITDADISSTDLQPDEDAIAKNTKVIHSFLTHPLESQDLHKQTSSVLQNKIFPTSSSFLGRFLVKQLNIFSSRR